MLNGDLEIRAVHWQKRNVLFRDGFITYRTSSCVGTHTTSTFNSQFICMIHAFHCNYCYSVDCLQKTNDVDVRVSRVCNMMIVAGNE
jgi:hypothetical protein